MAKRMTMEEGGRDLGRRALSLSRLGLLLFFLFLIAGTLIASPVWSAQVMDVRIGKHPKFTRVVFELDAPAGYRIERSKTSSGVSLLMVTVEAQSGQRNIKAPKSLIKGVAVRPDDKRSLAQIQLSKPGLRLKEMILSNPTRIVLDVFDEPAVAKATPAKPPPAKTVVAAPKPAPVKPVVSPKAAETVVEEAATSVAAEEIVHEAVPEPVLEAAAPEAEPEIPASLPESATPSAAELADERELLEADPLEAASLEASEWQDELEMPPSDLAEVALPVDEREALEEMPIERSQAAAPARPVPATALPELAPDSAPEAKSLLDPTTLAMAAGGMILLVGGLRFLRKRRRSADEEVDDEMLADDNPFVGLSLGGQGNATAQPVVDSPMSDEDNFQLPVAEAPGAEAKDTTMDQTDMMSDMGVSPAAGGAAGDDVMALVRDLERRLSAVESRLEESLEARERLERQVAAQTEELRVQRAAIARTQRAVRNLTRAEEELPTEPAIRDPERPSPGGM